MRAALSRAWHSPRTGPVILVLFGLPALALVVAMLAVPVLLLVELARFLAGGTPRGIAPAWLIGLVALAWLLAMAVSLQARRVARGNRGLDIQIALRQRGRPASALGVAKRLGAAMRAPDLDVSAPIREDYGAGVWVAREAERFWIAVSEAGPAAVVVSLAYDPGPDWRARLTHRADRALFARLEAALRQAVAADPALEPDEAA